MKIRYKVSSLKCKKCNRRLYPSSLEKPKKYVCKKCNEIYLIENIAKDFFNKYGN